MKTRGLVAGLSLVLAANLFAEDKVKAKIEGSVEVEGIDFSGKIVGDTASAGFVSHPVTGNVSIVTKRGRVHRVETFTSWSAENGVHGQVWEKLYVSGGTYTGWTERLIQTPDHIVFSRNVIDGSFDQKIRKDGSGYVKWTVAGEDNGVDNSSVDQTDDSDDADEESATTSSSTTVSDTSDQTDETLPTVEIEEEGEFDGVSERRIDIDAHRGHHPKMRFRDEGYTRMELTEESAGQAGNKNSELTEGKTTFTRTVNQKLDLEGRGKGDLSFTPKEESSESTPTPTPQSTATPTVSTTDDSGSTDDTLF